jgi:DNA-binding PadR family transcriptional regulator
MQSRLSPVVLHILLALADSKRHGYGIAGEVEEQSGGRVRLGPATLYTTLQRLLDQGSIATAEAPVGVDERRRYYRLTPAGRVALEAEITLMETVVRKARSLRVKPATSKA